LLLPNPEPVSALLGEGGTAGLLPETATFVELLLLLLLFLPRRCFLLLLPVTLLPWLLFELILSERLVDTSTLLLLLLADASSRTGPLLVLLVLPSTTLSQAGCSVARGDAPPLPTGAEADAGW